MQFCGSFAYADVGLSKIAPNLDKHTGACVMSVSFIAPEPHIYRAADSTI